MNLDQFIGDGKTHRIPLIWDDAPYSPPEGSVLIWTAKRSDSDLDPAALVQKISGVNLTVSGTDALVTLVHADTVAMATKIAAIWDIQCQAPGESPKTLNSGLIAFRRDITRALTTSIPIFTINPPAVVGGDYVSAAIAVETSSREAADESLAGDIASEVSARTSADQSLTTRVSIEESTRIAQDALKLDKSGGTVTGLVAIKPDSGNATLEVDAVTAGQAEMLLKKNGINAWKWVAGTDGKLRLNWYNQTSGSLNASVLTVDNLTGYFTSGVNWTFSAPVTLSSTLTANGAATFNSTLTVGGTNVMTELAGKEPAITGSTSFKVWAGDKTWQPAVRSFSVATLLGWATTLPAFCADLGIAYATGAYRLDGTIGRVLAQWDGDSSAGVWRISGTLVAVTADALAFARGLRAAGENRAMQSGATFFGNDGLPHKYSLNDGYFAPSPYYQNAIEVGTGSSGLVKLSTGAMKYRANCAILYGAAKITQLAASDVIDPYSIRVGFDDGYGGAAFDYSAVAILDPQNVSGAGALSTLSAVAKSTNAAVLSGGPSSLDGQLIECVMLPSGFSVYVDGARIGGAEITTNLYNQYYPRGFSVVVAKGGGANNRAIRVSDMYAVAL